ncbi:MAG: BadF/BadG/BcrA/BcrD ATPase family protein [Candidatus Izemoplasmatales bacterium]
METRHFLGFDGGGTKTHACLMDEHGAIVAQAFGPASSIDTVPLETSLTSLMTTYEALPVKRPLSAVFAGLGGIAGEHDRTRYVASLKTLPFVPGDAVLGAENDVVNALASGNGTLEGMALIIGTGSVCFGMKEGRSWRTGGYHFKEGDAGSGFDLGFMALKHYARVLDGRHPDTVFGEALRGALGIHDFARLVKYFDQINRTEVAKLAPIVTAFATVDQYAYKIVVDAADEIRLLVQTVYEKLGFTDCDLTVVGGLGNADTIYRDLFLGNIRKVSPSIRIIRPLYDPAHAAAMIARSLFDDAGGRHDR